MTGGKFAPLNIMNNEDAGTDSMITTFNTAVNHKPSQKSCKDEYELWKWGATAKYYASDLDHVTNEEICAMSSSQSDHTKTS